MPLGFCLKRLALPAYAAEHVIGTLIIKYPEQQNAYNLNWWPPESLICTTYVKKLNSMENYVHLANIRQTWETAWYFFNDFHVLYDDPKSIGG